MIRQLVINDSAFERKGGAYFVIEHSLSVPARMPLQCKFQLAIY